MKQFIVIISLLIILLIFHDAVIIGTRDGLLLWYQTLIPSLLPFILVTNALSETNAYQVVAQRFQKRNSSRIYEIMAILLGNLCGYPIGGKIINDFVKNHCITVKKAQQLLPLSSQASPMFLIGYIYTHSVHSSIPLGIFLGSIYLPVFFFYLLLCTFKDKHTYTSHCIPNKNINIKDTFLHAVEIMVMIGVYVMIFSIFLTILIPHCQSPISQILLSFLEITTGIKLMNSIAINESLRLAFITALSAFGGICSAYQVKGVLEYENKGIKKYLLDKFILSAGTFCIIYLYLTFN